MSSLEIAELTMKSHERVMQIVREGLIQRNLDPNDFLCVDQPSKVAVYRLPRALCLDIVNGNRRFFPGQSRAVVKYWEKLVGKEVVIRDLLGESEPVDASLEKWSAQIQDTIRQRRADRDAQRTPATHPSPYALDPPASVSAVQPTWTTAPQEPTITSLEISKITGKEHTDVMQIIREALDRLNLDHLAYRTVEPPKQIVVYRLPRDLSLAVVGTGYFTDDQSEMIRAYWDKLENPMLTLAPTDPEAPVATPVSPAAQSGLEIFDSPEFGPVRTVVEDGKPLFCARDVALALGYSDSDQAVRTHCKSAQTCPVDFTGQVRHVRFIPESDVYRLVMRSKLPGAERFQDWVVEDVLPALRQTGRFEVAPAVPQTLSAALRLAADLAEQNEAQSRQLAEKDARIEELSPKAEFYERFCEADGLCSIRSTAQALGIPERKFIAACIARGVLYRAPGSDRLMTYSKYLRSGNGLGYLGVRTVEKANGDATTQTMFTAKGIAWVHRFIGDSWRDL